MKSKTQQAVMPRFFIKTDSWHYRYFIYIRNFWGMAEPPAKTSLCPYCQTMIWFTVAAILTSPLWIVGYALMRITTFAIKQLDRFDFEETSYVVDRTPIARVLKDHSSTTVNKNSVFYPLLMVGAWVVSIAIIGIGIGGILFIVGVALYSIYQLVINLPYLITHAAFGIKEAALMVGWFVFEGFALATTVVIEIWGAIKIAGAWFGWLFTRKKTWLFIGICATLFITYILYMNFIDKILQTKAYKSTSKFINDVFEYIVEWIEQKVNNVKNRRAERRRIAADAAVKARFAAREAGDEDKEYEEPKPREILRFFRVFSATRNGVKYTFNGIGSAWRKASGAVKEKVPVGKDAAVTVLGPIGIAGLFLLSLKKRACPTIEFVSEEAMELVKGISFASSDDEINIKDLSKYRKTVEWFNIKNDQATKIEIVNKFFRKEMHTKRDEDRSDLWRLVAPGPANALMGQYILGQITYRMMITNLEEIHSGLIAREKLHHHQEIADEVGRMIDDRASLHKLKAEVESELY